MLDFTKIKEFTAQYIDKSDEEIYTYLQVEDSLQSDEELESITVILKNEKQSASSDLFHIKIIKRDNKYFLSSDQFDDKSTPHRLDVFEGNNEFIFLHRYPPAVIMYLHAHYE